MGELVWGKCQDPRGNKETRKLSTVPVSQHEDGRLLQVTDSMQRTRTVDYMIILRGRRISSLAPARPGQTVFRTGHSWFFA